MNERTIFAALRARAWADPLTGREPRGVLDAQHTEMLNPSVAVALSLNR